MDNIVKSLAQLIVWILITVGGLCMLLSPIARYATGEEQYLWIFLGASFVALVIALAINKLLSTIAS
jgi:hypothetical protein